MAAHGIMFHHFCGGNHPRGQGAISGDELAAMIQFLSPQRILPARQWMERAAAGTLHDEDLCLTFDDNLRCQYDIACPVLADFGLTAFWFVYSSVLEGGLERLELYRYFRTTCFDSVEPFYIAFEEAVEQSAHGPAMAQAIKRFDPATYLAGFPFYTDADRRFRFVRDEVLGPSAYEQVMDEMIARRGINLRDLSPTLWMNADNLKQLDAAGHVIGLHSHSHPTRMQRLDRDGQHREYQTNHTALTRILGEAPRAMSHPCNSYNADTLDVLRGLGIRLGFRANMVQQPAPSQLEHPREDHANVMRAMAEHRP